MLTRAAERVADHTKRIVQLELELATLELKRKLGTLGVGIALVVGGAIVAFFALVYYIAPNVEMRSWKWITPGAIVGSLLWLALSALFALYATFSGSYSRTYGALATGVILLLWLNYTAWAILFGAELNAEVRRPASDES